MKNNRIITQNRAMKSLIENFVPRRTTTTGNTLLERISQNSK